MRRFTKVVILLAIEIIIMVAFVSYSDFSRLASTVIFPPLFAVTIYLFIIAALDVEHKGLKRIDFVFALLLASVALISSGVGFHYAANDINDEFIPFLVEPYIADDVIDRVGYLDEVFSHFIMLTGFGGIAISFVLWWYIRRFKILSEKIDVFSEGTIFDNFIIIFIGALFGGIAALGSIESGVLRYSIAILSIASVMFLLKFKKTRSVPQKDLQMFFITFTATYFAVAISYYLLIKSGAVTCMV